jgi:alpha-1,6-mannosyltransferase
MAIKTLHLTNAYHPTSGGIRTFYRALLARANDERRRMRLIVPGPADAIEEVGGFGRIYVVKSRPAPAFDRRYRMISPFAYLGASGRLREILRCEQPDLLEVCDKYSLFYLAALLRKQLIPGIKRPVLVALSCERMDDNVAAYASGRAVARWFSRQYLRRLYGPPFDAHIANSEYTADELRRALWDRDPGFIQVCPMGVDATAFGPVHRDRHLRRELLSRAGGTPESILLLYAGRLSPEKNPGLLIDMLAKLRQPRPDRSEPDYRLVLAGDGPEAAPLARAAERRVPGAVLSMGVVQDRGTLARLYASADVFVHPNPREPFGIGPLEAMASRVPVVVPNAGGVLSYATYRTAWLASPDAESFAMAVRSVVTTPDQARLAAAADVARAHDWSLVAGRFFKLYDELHRRHTAREHKMFAPGAATPLDFAMSIPASHRVVTGLGHSALREGR